MPYEYLEHQADVGLQASGATLDEALTDAVTGLLHLLTDHATVEPRESVPVTATAGDPGSLFVALLNAVLAEKDIRGMFFREFRLASLTEQDGHWSASGKLRGEPIDLARHVVDTDVKAATYGGFLAHNDDHGWTLRCVLDL